MRGDISLTGRFAVAIASHIPLEAQGRGYP